MTTREVEAKDCYQCVRTGAIYFCADCGFSGCHACLCAHVDEQHMGERLRKRAEKACDAAWEHNG
jgi:hypothetical protein